MIGPRLAEAHDCLRVALIDPGDFTLRTVPGLLDRPGPRRWMKLADEHDRLPRQLLRG